MTDSSHTRRPLPYPFESRAGSALLRRATPEDADPLIALLSDDPISAARGDTASTEDRDAYTSALDEILAEPSNDLLVVEHDGVVVGTRQLTSIPGMARRGARRLLVEAVPVRSDLRSSGIGSAVMRWVSDAAASALGAPLVQQRSSHHVRRGLQHETRATSTRFMLQTPSHGQKRPGRARDVGVRIRVTSRSPTPDDPVTLAP